MSSLLKLVWPSESERNNELSLLGSKSSILPDSENDSSFTPQQVKDRVKAIDTAVENTLNNLKKLEKIDKNDENKLYNWRTWSQKQKEKYAGSSNREMKKSYLLKIAKLSHLPNTGIPNSGDTNVSDVSMLSSEERDPVMVMETKTVTNPEFETPTVPVRPMHSKVAITPTYSYEELHKKLTEIQHALIIADVVAEDEDPGKILEQVPKMQIEKIKLQKQIEAIDKKLQSIERNGKHIRDYVDTQQIMKVMVESKPAKKNKRSRNNNKK